MGVPMRRLPQQTELYAYLRKEGCHGNKRPAPCNYGDHDYCQAASTKLHHHDAAVVTETTAATYAMEDDGPAPDSTPSSRAAPHRKLDIRAELDRHFGPQPLTHTHMHTHKPLDGGSEEAELACPQRREDNEQEAEFVGGYQCLEVGLLQVRKKRKQEVEGLLEEVGVESGEELGCELGGYECLGAPGLDELLGPWEGDGQLDLPFHCPAPFSPSPRHTHFSPRWISRSRSPHTRSSSWSRSSLDLYSVTSLNSPQSYSRHPRCASYEDYQHEGLCPEEEVQTLPSKHQLSKTGQREDKHHRAEERRVVCVGLKRRFEVFGEIEECAVNLRDDGCDASPAVRLGHTLRRNGEPQVKHCSFTYTDLDEFDPASSKSKYDCMDFDSLLLEAQQSLRR